MIVGKTASEIFDNIRHLIQSGVLKPGETLPPVRELAAELTVNRNTVAAVYKRLVTSGLAVSQGRNGTAIKSANAPLPQEGGDPRRHSEISPVVTRIPAACRISLAI